MLSYVSPVVLQPNHIIMLHERRHKVCKREGDVWLLDPLNGDELKRVKAREVDEGFATRKITFLGHNTDTANPSYRSARGKAIVGVQSFTEEQEAFVARKAAYIAVLEGAPRGFRTPERLQALINGAARERKDKDSPNWRTVYDWKKAKDDNNGSTKALLRRPTFKSPMRRTKFSSEVTNCLESAFLGVYLATPHTTIADAAGSAVDRIKALNVVLTETSRLPDGGLNTALTLHEIPSRATLYRYMKSRINYEVQVKKFGADTARKMLRHSGGIVEVQNALELVEMDNTKLNNLAFIAENIPPERPWCSVVFDVATEMPLGFYLGFEAPSVLTSLAALEMAILDKGWLKDQYPNIRGSWPAHGTMTTVGHDNGAEYSEAFRETLAGLGINTQPIPPRTPYKNAHVERFHRGLQQCLARELGATGNRQSPANSKETSPPERLPTLARLKELILKYIVEVYQVTQKEGSGERPLDKWMELCEGVRPPIQADHLKVLAGKTESCRAHHDGITICGIQYNAEILGVIRRKALKPITDQKVRGLPVTVKTFKADVSMIYVLDPETNAFFQLNAVKQDLYRGVSAIEHAAIRKRALELSRERLGADFRGAISDKDYERAKCTIRGEPYQAVAKGRRGRGLAAALQQQAIDRNVYKVKSATPDPLFYSVLEKETPIPIEIQPPHDDGSDTADSNQAASPLTIQECETEDAPMSAGRYSVTLLEPGA